MTQTSTTEDDSSTALATLRAMVAIADSTVEKVTGQLTLTQFRALRTTVTLTPVTMTRVAQELDITPSSVTRACERLVTAGLLQRAANPLNRREILLAPTAAGRQTVNRVDQDRRAALIAILDRLPAEVRASVVAAFGHFARAADNSTVS